MPGSIDAQLTQTGQTDGTAGTAGPGNTGFSSLTTGSGNTIVHKDAAKMGAPAGIRLTQGGANQNLAYLDSASARAIFTLRWPINIPTPTASCPVLRFYPDTAHTANLGTIQWLTSNRVQFIEGSTGGGTPLNLTSSSGTPLSALTNYYIEVLINVSTDAFTLNVYPLGSTTPAFTALTGTLGADMAAASGIQSVRWSIGAASAASQADTNSWAAIGDGTGGVLARPDTVPTVTIDPGASNLEPGTTRTINMSATANGGKTISSRSLTQVSGSPSVSISNPATGVYTYTVPATTGGTALSFKASATDSGGMSADSSTINDVVLPHDNWSWNASGLLVPVFMLQPWSA